ncbi:MAG TPA: hypothetical protein ENK19_09545 [Acidobacteria bacterium]|nr:hypothetical protein [Acidobacteriota bacterium]
MNAAASLVLTLLLGLAIVGLGRAAGARRAPLAWLAGWTILWWVTALVATVAGPKWGAGVGLVVACGGLAAWFVTSERRRQELLLAAGAALAGAPFFLTPPYFYDALVYHLGLPWSWLINGSFAPIAHNVFSHFPLAGSTVYLLPVFFGLPGAAAGLHWLTFCLVLVASWRLARNLGAGRWSWIGPLCMLSCWHGVWLAGVAGVDQLVVLATAVAATALLTEDEEYSGATGAGVAVGLGVATKYTAVLPLGAVLAAAMVLPGRRRDAIRAALIGGGLASFWYLRNLLLTGNPVYPVLWKLFGGAGWTARDAVRWTRTVHEGVGGLWSYWEGFLALGRARSGLGAWLAIAVLLAVIALYRGRRRAIGRTAFAASLMVAAWLATSHTTRYALPLIPLVGALAAAGVERLDRGPRRVAVAGLLVTCAFGMVLFGQFVLGTLHLQELWLGRVEADQWRHRVTVNDPMPVYRAAGRLLPENARVLVIGEGRPWGCPRPHSVSSPYDTPLIQTIIEKTGSAAGAARAIRAAGWRDLIINWGELRRLHKSFGIFDLRTPDDVAAWRGLLDNETTPVWREGDLEIRRLKSGERHVAGGSPATSGTSSEP